MSLTEPTTDSAVLSTMKTLIENQTLAVHQTLQQYMSTVDSRFEELRSQINCSVGALVGSSRPMAPEPASLTVLSGVSDISPLLRSMKMDVPKFDGTDPNGWDFRINEFFDFHGTPDQLRLRIVSFHMEGKAAAWYQWMKANNLLSTWHNFLLNLKQKFGTSMYEDHQGNLSKLSQTSTVADFQYAFKDLMNKVTGISEPLLVSFFITGLKPDIRRELLFARPTSLMEAFALAKAYEARSEEIKTSSRSWTKWTPSSTHTHQSTITASPQPASYKTPTTTPLPSLSATKQPPQPPLLPTPTLPIHRLTPTELGEKRDKGLCYNCDQKYSATHRCRSKFLLLIGTDDEDDEPSEDAFSHAQPDEVVTADISSLNALAGQTNPRSLRVLGTVASYQFQVLIDSGSTHNFLKPPLAKRLGLSVQAIPPFRVYISNGDFLTCRFLCPKVPINMQGHEFLLDFFLLPIEGPDAVLRIQWLQSLGRISMDYSEMTMEFQWEGKSVILRGDPIPNPNLISFNQFHALLSNSKIDSLFELHSLSTEPSATHTSTNTLPDNDFEFLRSLPEPITTLLKKFKALFAPPTGLPPQRLFDHKIHLIPNSKPVNVRPYRYPYFQKTEMEKLVREMLNQGIIKPSQSPFSSPVMLVKKKDGSYRFCVDYRAVNAVTVKDKFPVPTIDELFDELGGARIFSKLDLRAGYHQIRVHKRDTYKTAFHTYDGHYEFLVMPFGLTNAPSTFQATMNQLFASFLRKFVIVFFDDILVYSASLAEHVHHLEQVMSCLYTSQFYVKFSKCLFCQESIDYLGHIVSARGVHADPQKITAMVDWPLPKSVKRLRGFLGLTGYYRRFIQGYATIAAPLTELLCKEAFHWNLAATQAFQALKKALVEAPVLHLPNFALEFVIETDASNVGIGAVLMQAGHPLSYFSKKLGPRIRASSTYLKELYAIVAAVQKWRQYLLGRFFLIRTDHKSIKELFQQVIHTPEQQFYIRKLMGYQFRIDYKAGTFNKAADALSRIHRDNVTEEPKPTTLCLSFVSQPSSELLTNLHKENCSLPDMKQLHQRYAAGSLSSAFSVQEGFLIFRHRYYLSPNSSLKVVLLKEFHETPMAGHAGIKKTLVRLSSTFFWPKMREDVEQHVAACIVCQQIKYSTQAPAGLLQPLPVPSLVWDELTMDFITGLPLSRGFEAILVVVDRLSKSAHFGALPSQFTTIKTAALFADMVVKLHGFPSSIISYRDPIFMSNFWQKLFDLSGTQLRHSTAYHPQTDGQSEVVNRGLEQYLRAFSQDKPQTWSSFLGWAEFCYNTSYHSSLRMTPFQALYGRFPPTIPSYSRGSTSIQALEDMLIERDAMLCSLKENLRQAQHRMAQKANLHRRETQLQVGDKVLVHLQPYRQTSIAKRSSHKLARRYYGPFTVVERIGPVAYKLELPTNCRIHPVFHISLLKPYVGNSPIDVYSLPPGSVDNKPLSSPIAVCAERKILRQGKEIPQILVQWSDSSPENSTWEDFEEFCKLYPALHLEDKVSFQGMGNDTTWPIVVNQIEHNETAREETQPAEMEEVQPVNETQAREQLKTGSARARKKPGWLKDFVI
ncbi:hypothetical protein KPL70_021062 [Citrus sinensis]|nr:hypothetical protein KPL70_021062 [Citrus sinensis]KAH9667505.1 hypothetical protein KPL70_021062 [Citrus sinensis]